MKKLHSVAAALCAVVLMGSQAAFAAQPVPVPKIAVIDRTLVFRLSAAGKDMIFQLNAATKKAESDIKAESDKLRSDAKALQQQMAILAPEARAQKQKQFQAREDALKKKVQDREATIQNAFTGGRKQIEAAIEPILREVMKERAANMLLDRNAVVYSSINVDITPDVIARLDKKLPKVKLVFQAPAAKPKAN